MRPRRGGALDRLVRRVFFVIFNLDYLLGGDGGAGGDEPGGGGGGGGARADGADEAPAAPKPADAL